MMSELFNITCQDFTQRNTIRKMGRLDTFANLTLAGKVHAALHFVSDQTAGVLNVNQEIDGISVCDTPQQKHPPAQ